jgi:hypothetical protein
MMSNPHPVFLDPDMPMSTVPTVVRSVYVYTEFITSYHRNGRRRLKYRAPVSGTWPAQLGKQESQFTL